MRLDLVLADLFGAEWADEARLAMRRGVCFGGKSGGGTNTVTQNSAPPPQVMAAYQNLVGRAQGVSQTPYSQYSGNLVAGFQPQQTAAFNQIQNAAGLANPYISSANQYFQNAGQPITPMAFSPGSVNQYYNPYQQEVVGATQAEFNNQNQQQNSQLEGQAASYGAWGGDRASVAQGILAGQQQLAQAPVLAGLQQQGYNTALGEFNTQQQVGLGAQEASKWLSQAAGYGTAGLGSEAQNTALTGASANLQAGALQQQLSQENLNVPYEQWLASQSYPYQQLGFLAPIVEGTGSLSGGSASTTYPGPNATAQDIGLGLSGLGMLGSTGALSGLGSLFSSGAIGGAAAAGSIPLGMSMAGGSLGAGALFSRGGHVGTRNRLQAGGLADGIAADAGAFPFAGTVASMPVPTYVSPISTIGSSASNGVMRGSGPPHAAPAGPALQPQGAGVAGWLESGLSAGNQIGNLLRGSGSTATTATQGASPSWVNYLGDAAGLANIVGMLAKGGRVDARSRLQAGGLAAGAAAAGIPGAVGVNPLTAGLYQQFSQMSPEQLQELQMRMPPNSLYGQAINRVLEMKRFTPQPVQTSPGAPSASAGPSLATAPSAPEATMGTAAPSVGPPPGLMRRGGLVAHRRLQGGGLSGDGQVLEMPLPPPGTPNQPNEELAGLWTPDPQGTPVATKGTVSPAPAHVYPSMGLPSGAPLDKQGIAAGTHSGTPPVTSDDLDPSPVVDHSGSTIKVHYGSEGNTLDTGIPTQPHDASSESPADRGYNELTAHSGYGVENAPWWYTLADIGARIAANPTPFPGVAIGQAMAGYLQQAPAVEHQALQNQFTQYEKPGYQLGAKIEENMLHGRPMGAGTATPGITGGMGGAPGGYASPSGGMGSGSNIAPFAEMGAMGIPQFRGAESLYGTILKNSPGIQAQIAEAKATAANPISIDLELARRYAGTPIGNIYQTEALWKSGLIPAQQAQERIAQNAQRIGISQGQLGLEALKEGVPTPAGAGAPVVGAGRPGGVPAAVPGATPSVTGNSWSTALTPDNPRVQAIARYQIPPGSQWGANTPYSTALMDAVLKVNPNYDATLYGARNRAVNEFATGPQGNAVRSFNVAIQHLNVLGQAANALGNGDVKAFNAAQQAIAEQFGVAAPNNFDAVKQIVGQEITKAIIAGGGGVTERQAAAETVSRANSPQQLDGVINQYENLMAGQLNGLRGQYESSTGLQNFDERLLPATRAAMFAHGYAASAARGPNGQMIYSDGRTWYDANGMPYQ